MKRSVLMRVRWRDMFSWKSKPDSANTEASAVQQQHLEDERRERLASYSVEQRKKMADPSDLEERNELDSIIARGFLKSKKPYSPQPDVKERLREVFGNHASTNANKSRQPTEYDSWMTISLDEPGLKFEILTLLEKRLGHPVPNSRLHEMKTAADLVAYYEEPIRNVTTYVDLARSENRPKNLHIAEDPFQFHPADTDAYHGGITARPGEGSTFTHPREKRLYRGFKGKTDWHHFQDKHFDYLDGPPDEAPWNPEVAKRADNIGAVASVSTDREKFKPDKYKF